MDDVVDWSIEPSEVLMADCKGQIVIVKAQKYRLHIALKEPNLEVRHKTMFDSRCMLSGD